jgi:uncharacterized protein GlcG (DUF336 family)
MSEDVVFQPTVSLALADRLVRASAAAALGRGVQIAAVVVDSSGSVVAAARMDGANAVAMRLAEDKAFTAVAFGAGTDSWTRATEPGGPDWGLALAVSGRIVVVAGGLPLLIDGRVIGGLGVSGAAPSVDRACAEDALRAESGSLGSSGSADV